MTQIAKVREDNTSIATYTGTNSIVTPTIPVEKAVEVSEGGGRSLVLEINDNVNAKGSIG